MSEDTQLLMLTGLWKKTSPKTGEDYLTSGLTYGTQVFVFENKFKRKPSDPDYKLCIGPKSKSKQDGAPWDASAEPSPIGDEDYRPPAAEDDVPF